MAQNASCPTRRPSFKILTKLRSMDLLSKLRSNQYIVPSQLNELLSEGAAELVEYQNAIDELQEMIIVLSNERDVLSNNRESLQRHLQRAKSLTAPIRNVPPEILGQIFIEHGADNDIQTLRHCSRIPGLKVASISKHWRSVAVTTPALWNTICLDVDVKDVLPLASLISRSAQSPLHVTIKHRRWLRSDHAALHLLCEQAHRWQGLNVLLGADSYPSAPRTALLSLRGKLTKLATFHCRSDKYYPLLEGTTDLRDMTISYSGSNTLSQLPHLSSLHTLRVYSPRGSIEDGPGVVLPSVRLLVIKIDGSMEEDRFLASIFNRLTLPDLFSLSVTTEAPKTPETDDSDDNPISTGNNGWLTAELPNLFQRSNVAEKLSGLKFANIDLPLRSLRGLLESLRCLTALTIDEPSIAPHPILTDDFFLLIDARRGEVIPRLDSLTLIANSLSFDMQLFMQVIQFRWKPSPDEHHDVASLKSVDLTIRKGKVAYSFVTSLMTLRRRGLCLSVADQDGDIAIREDEVW